MKKLFGYILCVAMLAGLASCTNNPEEPKDPQVQPTDTTSTEPKVDVDPEGLVGEWELYRYTAKVEVTLMDTMKLVNEDIDSTFTEETYKIRLTADSLLLIDGDTVGTWEYYEDDDVLIVRTEVLNDMFGDFDASGALDDISNQFGFDMSQMELPTLDFSEITMDINSFTEHKAKTSFKKEATGMYILFKYSYSIKVALYLRR